MGIKTISLDETRRHTAFRNICALIWAVYLAAVSHVVRTTYESRCLSRVAQAFRRAKGKQGINSWGWLNWPILRNWFKSNWKKLHWKGAPSEVIKCVPHSILLYLNAFRFPSSRLVSNLDPGLWISNRGRKTPLKVAVKPLDRIGFNTSCVMSRHNLHGSQDVGFKRDFRHMIKVHWNSYCGSIKPVIRE